MKLDRVHVREFKSIWDSDPFSLGKVTCLVGKNEAGKTCLLQALYKLNPIVPMDGDFDAVEDYPRAAADDYLQEVEEGTREHATVIEASFALDPEELTAIEASFGPNVLTEPAVLISKGYLAGANGKNQRFIRVPVDAEAFDRNLLVRTGVPAALAEECEPYLPDPFALLEFLQGRGDDAAELVRLRDALEEILAHGSLSMHVWNTTLRKNLPKFLYFDSYYQMTGRANLEALRERRESEALLPSDLPLLGLLELARLDLDKLLGTKRTRGLKNALQSASNRLSRQLLTYWSQNQELRMNFDVRPAQDDDPEGMRQGTNLWGEVYDALHMVSTGLGDRSTGFVWFFSFLAWYSAEKAKGQPMVLLLDEPGLSLHGRAQRDLLRYFDQEIASYPDHQLVYTTHSPFMVDATRLDRVRIVQDVVPGDDAEPDDDALEGTKVLTSIGLAEEDTLFPLKGALALEVQQSLLSGPASLLVEHTADLVVLEAISSQLALAGRTAMDPSWRLVPVGGATRVGAFLALAEASDANTAILADLRLADPTMIEGLESRHLLARTRVTSYADLLEAAEADVEDVLGAGAYAAMMNEAFGTDVRESDLLGEGRLLRRAEAALPNGKTFDRLAPAAALARGSVKVDAEVLDRFEALFTRLHALLD
ncbi:MAG: AAA family ATPase [Myxococcota bacterium]